MLAISPRARILSALVALLLLAPVIGIRYQDTDALARFHGHYLPQWPAAGTFAADPAAWFRVARSWLAERAWPVVEATWLEKNLQYFAFGVAPLAHMSIGRNGYVFLNGWEPQRVNSLYESVCVAAHSTQVRDQLRDALPALAAFSRRRGLPVDIVVFPTLPTLYARYLPLSTPARYRSACGAIESGGSPLRSLEAPAGVTFLYPFDAMRANTDEAFYPKGNWHPMGMSVKVVRDTYLARLGLGVPTDEGVQRGDVPSELLSSAGVRDSRPVYGIGNPHVRPSPAQNAALNRALLELYSTPVVSTTFFVNDAPTVPQSVLMVADSFGYEASRMFAGAFRSVAQANATGTQASRLLELVDRASAVQRPDRLILLVQEGNLPLIAEAARALGSAGETAAGATP